MGSRDCDHAHFLERFVRVMSCTIPGNTPAKFEVRTFSRFGTDGQADSHQNRPIRNDSVVIWLLHDAGVNATQVLTQVLTPASCTCVTCAGHRTSDIGQRTTDNGHR